MRNPKICSLKSEISNPSFPSLSFQFFPSAKILKMFSPPTHHLWLGGYPLQRKPALIAAPHFNAGFSLCCIFADKSCVLFLENTPQRWVELICRSSKDEELEYRIIATNKTGEGPPSNTVMVVL
jgi:hypothetical protein